MNFKSEEYVKSEISVISVEENNFSKFQKLINIKLSNESLLFSDNSTKAGSNIKVFTMAALVGKFVAKERKPFQSKAKGYFRYLDNEKKEEMTILKTLAINEVDDVNILIDHKKLFKICEEYANAGIPILYEWYFKDDINFDEKIFSVMERSFEENEKNGLI